MYFPAFVTWLRQLGRWVVVELFQVALWVAFALPLLASLRSAFRGGGALGARAGRAIRPRRSSGPARGGRFSHSAAA